MSKSAGAKALLESTLMADPVALELDAQYRQVREECGLLDRSERGKLTIGGGEAVEYLQGQLTNDVEALAPGEGQYAALLDRKGHMQADMRVLRTSPEEIWIDTEPEALATARRHLEMYKIGRDVTIADVTGERTILSLLGPRSVEIAATAALPEHACEATRLGGSDCLAVGTSGGVDLIADAADAANVREALVEAGAVEIGAEVAELARIEAGVPRF
jgi:folate-binding Fe-S cluster repair protein YgfZ